MQRRKAQRQRSTKSRGSNNDVPFGIRAIESGIEVEGVWISRGNTPEPVSRESSASSLWEHVPRKDYGIDLEKQDPSKYHDRTALHPPAATRRSDRSSFDRAVSAEKLPSSHISREPSPDAAVTKPPRSRHPPLSYTRYSSFNPYLLRQSSVTNTLQGLEDIHRASTSIHGDESSDSSNQSTNSTGDSGPISASAPGLLTGRAKAKPKHQSLNDFELLNSHRMSQAAETGQLTPRGRRPGHSHSVDHTGTSRPPRDSTSTERQDYFAARRRSQQPPSSNGQSGSPPAPAKMDALPLGVRRSSMPDVTSFADFCKNVPRGPPPESLRSSSSETSRSSRLASAHQRDDDSTPPSPIFPASAGAAELKLPQPRRSSFEKRASQIIRGHGSGFEILRPGSLNPKMPVEHPLEKKKAAPPISLQNASRARASSEDSRRKLQKKRRPSSVSTTSSRSSARSRVSLILP